MIFFKLFMAAMMLLVPFTMVGFGWRWKKKPPNRVNSIYGYRSRRSMISKRAWDYAHKISGRFWRVAGICTLAATLVAVGFMFAAHDISDAGKLGGITVFVQLFPLVAVIPVTESALKKKVSF